MHDVMTGASEQILVSIIIPSFNQGAFIRQTIESCLGQDYRPLEIIVIDGGSKDGTLDVLHKFDNVPEVRWISEPDDGVADAVNKGFAMARGDIAGIQASDDAYLPGAVSGAVGLFGSDPQLGLVYADCRNVDVEGNELSLFNSAPFTIENFLCASTLVLQPAAFFKLSLARELGGWNPRYFVCDTELWLRMIFRAKALKVDEVWAIRHIHPEQRNNQGNKIANSYRDMIVNSPDIASAPARLRRAATCGMYRVMANYSASRAVQYYRNWRAFLVYPEIVRKLPKFWGQMIPCYWNFYSLMLVFRRAASRFARIIRVTSAGS